MLELRIFRFDDQKETVARRQREVRRIKNRMIRLRQFIQRQHAEHREKSRHQHRAFESDRYERRPTIEWFTADVDWIVDHFHPVLHEEAAERAQMPLIKTIIG